MKLGKSPARKGAVKLRLGDYVTATATPSTFGHQNLVSDWGMLGNDRYGDCVFAGAGHEHMLWNAEAHTGFVTNEQATLRNYSAVTGFNPNDPSTDRGTDMETAAKYRRQTGLLDAAGRRHKVGAYLALDPHNIDEVLYAAYHFQAVGIGLRFPSSAMKQFDAGKPWTVVSRSPIEGGHYVPIVGRSPRYIQVVTWGRVQSMTLGFLRRYCDEAIVYLSEEMLSGGKTIDGLDLATLRADLARLTA